MKITGDATEKRLYKCTDNLMHYTLRSYLEKWQSNLWS